MRYFVVDDEAIILRDTARILDKVVREELQDDEPQIYTYSSAIQALEEAKEKKPFLFRGAAAPDLPDPPARRSQDRSP